MTDKARLKKSIVFIDGTIDELETIKTYIEQITSLEETANIEAINDNEKSQYEEIIGDELDHVSRFLTMFVDASGINPNGEAVE